MVQLSSPATSPTPSEIIYPESDGQPIADNTKQFRWIVTLKENLERLFAHDPQVFVAGDLLWYPVEGDNTICAAPDTLVVFGRPKGDRRSYQQWQEAHTPPQVVFEIRSPSNSQTELNKKQVFYNRYGVEEYYLYDPDTNDLSGWQRTDAGFDVIDPIDQWQSPRLGIQFSLSGPELQILTPTGDRFLTYVELGQRLDDAEQRANAAEQRADTAEQRADRLAERLRALGVDPEQE